jgi:pimeloyl-ACP methyl ester carboxylesterase
MNPSRPAARHLLLAAVAAGFLAAPLAADGCDDRFFDSAGVPIRFCVQGEGEPLVVIHGSSSAWRGRIADAFGPLAERYRLIGFDVRGHGKSGKPHDPGDYGPELVEDIVRLLDRLQLPSAHVVGYSMGGFIGLKLAAVYPQRVRTLTMVGQGLVAADEFERMAEGADDEGRSGDNDAVAIAAMIRSYPVLTVSDRTVRGLRVPILAVVGDRDPRFTRVVRLRALLPSTKVVVLPGRTHGSVIEDPALIPEVLGFLSRSSERAAKP